MRLALGVLLVCPVLAQAAIMEEVVISANKEGEVQDFAMLNTQVIQPDLTLSLSDNLRSAAGITLSTIHGQDGLGLKLQGVSEDQVLILLDGVPISNQGSTVNLNDIHIANIAQIEVVQGNATTLYGSQATAGVVNLVSKKAHGSQALFSLSQTAHTLEQLPDTRLQASVDWQIMAAKYAIQNQSVLSLQLPQATRRPSEAWQQETSGGHIVQLQQTLQAFDWQLGLAWQYKALSRQYDEQVVRKVVAKQQHEQRQQWDVTLSGHIKQLQNRFSLQTIDKYSSQDAIVTADQIDFYRQSESWQGYSDQHLNWHWGNHAFIAGISSQFETLKQRKTESSVTIDELAGMQSQAVLDVYAQDSWYWRNIELAGGLRGQFHADYAPFATPTLSLRWDITPHWVLRANTGLGYRIPTLKERYYFFDHSQFGYQVSGNDALEPERSFSNQISMNMNYQHLQSGLTAFVHQFNDLIETQLETELETELNNGLDNYRYQNIQQALIYGLQVSAASQIDTVKLSGNVQWLKSAQTVAGVQRELSKRPRWQLNQTIEWQWRPTWHVKSDLSCQSEQFSDADNEHRSPAYCLWNQHLTWHANEHFTSKLALLNSLGISKEDDDDYDQRPAKGRQLQLTLTYQY